MIPSSYLGDAPCSQARRKRSRSCSSSFPNGATECESCTGIATGSRCGQSGSRWPFLHHVSADGRLSVTNMEAAELALIIEGIYLAGARREPRKMKPEAASPQLFFLDVTLGTRPV